MSIVNNWPLRDVALRRRLETTAMLPHPSPIDDRTLTRNYLRCLNSPPRCRIESTYSRRVDRNSAMTSVPSIVLSVNSGRSSTKLTRLACLRQPTMIWVKNWTLFWFVVLNVFICFHFWRLIAEKTFVGYFDLWRPVI
jgi:hypothetical protein